MALYKIFKKNPSRFKFLTPLSPSNKLKVAKVVHCNDILVNYDEDIKMYFESAQSSRIYVGENVIGRDEETNELVDLGVLVDIQYDEFSGYLFIFNPPNGQAAA